MRINMFTNNRLELEGRIAAVKEYSVEKEAANVTIAIDNGKDKNGETKPASFIQLKSFSRKVYGILKNGMKVRVYGHVATSEYETKDNVKKYSTDLIADCIEFLESKSVIDNREALKNYYSDAE